MKRIILFVMSAILSISATAFADVKIKTKQTISGQSSENTTYIKDKRQRTEMMGGVLVTITQCDLSRDLQINPSTKTYVVNEYVSGGDTSAPAANPGTAGPATKGGTMYITTTTKDTGERKQMFGFTARHIVQTIEMETSPDSCNPTKNKMEMDMWVIDAEFGLACTQDRQYRPSPNSKSAGCQDKIVPKTIGSAKSGYPLWQKMTSFDANGKESFSSVQEVVEMSKATLDAALFDVPADYRKVENATQMYASASSSSSSGTSYNGPSSSTLPGVGSTYSTGTSSATTSSIKSAASATPGTDAPAVAAKKEGTIRVGITVKTTSVGEAISPADLTAAIRNTLGDYLKGTKIELVPLEAKLAAAVAGEAKDKGCDYILVATAAHKKGGGGGFGFGKMLAQTVAQTGIGHTGSVAGNIAGQIATTAIVSAGSFSGNVKSKDELTLDLNLQAAADGRSALAKQFKAKAKADGDDIISCSIGGFCTGACVTRGIDLACFTRFGT
ncbi:MAG TPA: hypothetical protein VHQ01_04800, partial [Pyrinomonadaceae bacterium]|nr:hypothetical protein [Pyrinomonadaceae bacterium]